MLLEPGLGLLLQVIASFLPPRYSSAQQIKANNFQRKKEKILGEIAVRTNSVGRSLNLPPTTAHVTSDQETRFLRLH